MNVLIHTGPVILHHNIPGGSAMPIVQPFYKDGQPSK